MEKGEAMERKSINFVLQVCWGISVGNDEWFRLGDARSAGAHGASFLISGMRAFFCYSAC